MLDMSLAALLEKNKVSSDGVWLLLLEILFQDVPSIRVVLNTENVPWCNEEWVAFPFEIDEVSENSKGELPSFSVRISNITKTVQQYVEASNGAINAEVILRVVHSKHLDLETPEVEEHFSVQHATCDNEWATFQLGGDSPNSLRYPGGRTSKDFCQYRNKYKGIQCGAVSDLPDCPGTLKACRERNNSRRFGGDPSIPVGGLYVSNSA